jgi:superfamily II DNA or RNA helicase
LWDDRTTSLAVVDFTAVSEEILQKFKTSTPPGIDPEERGLVLRSPSQNRGCKPSVPESIVLRSYQIDAANSWLKNNGKGILQLATGTGKTITALGIASNLAKRAGLQGLIIVCPFKHLVSQWDFSSG